MQPNPTLRRLTHREREIALLIADGLHIAVIARQLGLAPDTITTHIQGIQRRLRLANRMEIAAWVAERRSPGSPEGRLRRGDIGRVG
jgi:DNA-binding NarL/FixJ family response regulator